MNINPRCRFPSLQTPLLCVLKEPRAWKPPAIQSHVFQTFSFIVLSSDIFRSPFIAHRSRPIAHYPSLKMFFCLILLAGLARFAWVKQISIPIAVVLRCPFRICFDFISSSYCGLFWVDFPLWVEENSGTTSLKRPAKRCWICRRPCWDVYPFCKSSIIRWITGIRTGISFLHILKITSASTSK